MSACAVTLKLATSLDGKIATRTGQSRWITDEQSRACAHELRAAHDAVLVGVGTALADDPALTVRDGELERLRQPFRVALDTYLRLPLESRLVTSAHSYPVAVICGADASATRAAQLTERGVTVLRVGKAGRPEPADALNVLQHAFSIQSVMIEGGGAVAATFLKAGLVDRLEWFRAPIVLGGDGISSIGALALDDVAAAIPFRRVAVRALERDVWESYQRDR